jgi:deoxyhypusine synthase
MTDLGIIPLKNNLLKDWKLVEVKTTILNRINELHIHDQKYKNDTEFLILICNLLEHLVSKKDNIDKKELAVDIITTLFALTPDEQSVLKNNIDIIHLKKNIKKVSFWKLFKCGLSEFFFKSSTK